MQKSGWRTYINKNKRYADTHEIVRRGLKAEREPHRRDNVLKGILDRAEAILKNDSGISMGTETYLNEIIELISQELAD